MILLLSIIIISISLYLTTVNKYLIFITKTFYPYHYTIVGKYISMFINVEVILCKI